MIAAIQLLKLRLGTVPGRTAVGKIQIPPIGIQVLRITLGTVNGGMIITTHKMGLGTIPGGTAVGKIQILPIRI
jgi:hypothetical protein